MKYFDNNPELFTWCSVYIAIVFMLWIAWKAVQSKQTEEIWKDQEKRTVAIYSLEEIRLAVEEMAHSRGIDMGDKKVVFYRDNNGFTAAVVTKNKENDTLSW